MTTFESYASLPELIRNALLELETFIGGLDGEETGDGVIDTEDQVKAFNVIVAALALHQRPETAQQVTADDRLKDLKERVALFERMELPGQIKMMHMGTAYLVGDLWRMVQSLSALERQESADDIIERCACVASEAGFASPHIVAERIRALKSQPVIADQREEERRRRTPPPGASMDSDR